MIRVLHMISGNLHSGASRGVYVLHKGLRELGVDSKILCMSDTIYNSKYESTITPTLSDSLKRSVRTKLDKLPFMPFQPDDKSLFNSGTFGYNFTTHEFYQQADIIHLHWINNGFVRIKDLKKIDKPIVWTVRDMWPLTGGCHLSYGCERYKEMCGSCPQLKSSVEYDATYFIMKRKLKHYPKDMTMVGISPWISDLLSESKLFRDYSIRTIYNGIDCDEFSPVNKKTARKLLNIETSKKIISMGAQNLGVYHKGFHKFKEALSYLDRDKYFLIVFGKVDEQILEECNIEYKNFGFLYENVSIKLLYSSADIFVAPSIMESFGKTIAESMACGTPAIAFNDTGPKSIIDHKKSGYLSEPQNANDLARGIEWITEDSARNTELSKNARDKIVERFEVNDIAKKYNELYSGLI